MFALLMAAAIAPVYRDGPFTCTVPIINPDASRRVDHRKAQASPSGETASPFNGQSDVDVGGAFRSDFGVEGAFTLPEVPSNRGLFYSNWILLIPYKRHAFVQLELMRWRKFQFREEIGLTWAFADGALHYRDTGLWVGPGQHRLRIASSSGTLTMSVDGRAICGVPSSAFFAPQDQLYYQLGTEVEHAGDHPAGTLSNILIKDDSDGAYRRADPHCISHVDGLSWDYLGDGRYVADGVFDPAQPTVKFTGNTRNEPCVM